MLHKPETSTLEFRELYPEIPDEAIVSANDRLRRFATVAIEIASIAVRSDLTIARRGGTVSTGQVDPASNFTNTG
jgi:hypothetical protein